MKGFDYGQIPNTNVHWIRSKETGDYQASFNGKMFTVNRPSISLPLLTENRVYINAKGMCGPERKKILSAVSENRECIEAGCDLFCKGGVYVKYNPKVAGFDFDQFCQGLLVSIAGCI